MEDDFAYLKLKAEIFARRFESEALKDMNEAWEEMHKVRHSIKQMQKKEIDLKYKYLRERYENDRATVWLLGNDRHFLIEGSYEECKKWVAENNLEPVTEIYFEPEWSKWLLNNHEKKFNLKTNEQ